MAPQGEARDDLEDMLGGAPESPAADAPPPLLLPGEIPMPPGSPAPAVQPEAAASGEHKRIPRRTRGGSLRRVHTNPTKRLQVIEAVAKCPAG